jgi:hypothetical protein
MPGNVVTLLDLTTVSASGAGVAVDGLHRYQGVLGMLNVSAVPSGGAPTLDVYVQASPDGGTTWRDIAAFQFTTATAKKLFPISQLATGGTSILSTSDGALTSGTMVQGPFGDRLRVKYVFAAGGSTGTYTLSATMVPVGGP